MVCIRGAGCEDSPVEAASGGWAASGSVTQAAVVVGLLLALTGSARQVGRDGDHGREHAHEDEAARQTVVHDIGG